MPNYRAKGGYYMRALASRGGVAIGETRRKKKIAELLGLDPVPAELLERPKLSGGSHDTDWRCPYCRHVNSIKRQACAECAKTPANGLTTKAARREREEEHEIEAILRKHELSRRESERLQPATIKTDTPTMTAFHKKGPLISFFCSCRLERLPYRKDKRCRNT